MRFFPKLGERTVRLRIGGGQELEVRKLSIGDYDRFSAIIREVEQDCAAADLALSARAARMEKGGRQISQLLEPYFPDEPAADLFRLGYAGLIELGMYMAFGSDFEKTADGQGSKKN
jgi:hypothetical protein